MLYIFLLLDIDLNILIEYGGIINIANSCGNSLHNTVKSHPLASTHMVSALIQFYIDVESTGASSEFYDKFTIRYNIACLFISLWRDGFLKSHFVREAEYVSLL
ncbi:unnamed protein product [Protopolystoma xenopodis]|uniref:Ubiquitin conjugation factor E4 core domain-containing protein n=1 Tax=Protopolystoma xenopodis TaxID=117903 RepID=A0A3S5FDI8_9PLAT|nr:unnamed protein product [Protopolystoma xenopodis]